MVQWNFSAPNVGVGHDAPGALLRNIGEVLGVFGDVRVTLKPAGLLTPPGAIYERGSLQVENLRDIEQMVSTLRSPLWPFTEDDGDKASEADVAAGEKIYVDAMCKDCHHLIHRLNPPVPLPTERTPLSLVGTDPELSKKIGNDTGPTGLLQGTAKIFGPRFVLRFGATEKVALLTAQMGIALLPDDLQRLELIARGTLPAVISVLNPGYKARPLNGIWATAPYLHNGSVPTLRALLNPAICPANTTGCTPRPALFCVGDSEYDVANVGFQSYLDSAKSNTCPARTSLVDTTKFGSKNVGHQWGTTLSDQQKDQLVAYLKKL